VARTAGRPPVSSICTRILADHERRWMWDFYAFYGWYLMGKLSEEGSWL
jgi:hypothetical protein